MASTAQDRPRRSKGFRGVALVALATLACTTVRVPASGIAPSVPIHEDAAEPQLELWVESGKDVSAEEVARAAAEARGALQQALASRRLGEGPQLLVVRAQGVSRTGSRKADQKAAVAGIVAASVVIVAVAVVAIVASAKGGGRVPIPHAAPPSGFRPAPPRVGVSAVRVAPAAIPRPVSPPVAPPTRIAVRPPRPAGGPGHAHAAVSLGVNVQVGGPGPASPPPAMWSDVVVENAPPPPPPPARAEVVLPPPPSLDVERRGFFAGDSTRLELTLVDRATLQPLWVKVVESKHDPRDAEAVRALLDHALDDAAEWQPAPPAPSAIPPDAPWTPEPPAEPDV